jgi:hypothetical protein
MGLGMPIVEAHQAASPKLAEPVPAKIALV